MSDNNTLQRIEEIIRDLFDEYTGAVGLETSAADVDQWDSLGNVQLMVMVEQEFGVQFGTIEIDRLENIGDLVELVESKLD